MIKEWLKKYKLDNIPVIFCESYDDKLRIATENKVDVMIDDKIQVLHSFPPSIKKIWFCSDSKKINGTKKFQPEIYRQLVIAGIGILWKRISLLLNNII